MPLNRKLFVGNLPYGSTEADLDRLFSAAGEIEKSTIIRSQPSGLSRGFGFVQMADVPSAQAAVERFHEAPFHGHKLIVKMAHDRVSGEVRARVHRSAA